MNHVQMLWTDFVFFKLRLFQNYLNSLVMAEPTTKTIRINSVGTKQKYSQHLKYKIKQVL